jgi:hypothetical protein
MTPIPVTVKNVSIYPYINWPNHGGHGPVVLPLLTGGEGTYSVGTLFTSVFYNLNISSGTLHPENGTIELNGRYTAVGQYEDGSSFHTAVWEFCIETGSSPKFGRTISHAQSNQSMADESKSLVGWVPPYGILGPLTDITVTYSTLLDPIVIKLIENGSGNIIYSLYGTPHIMGVKVDSGTRVGVLRNGMQNINIIGTTSAGTRYSAIDLTCLDAGDPAIFFRLFP